MSSSSRVEILEDSDPEVIVIHEDDSEDDECFDMSNPMAHVKKDPSPPQAATKSAGAQGKVVQQTRKQAKAIKSKTDNTSPSQPTEDPLTKAKPSVATGNASAKLSPSHSAKKPGNTNNGGPALRSPLSESDLDESFVSVQKVIASTSSTESSDVDETLPVNRTSITLSKWASRFLAPRAPAALVEDVDLQPMQDFILDDFGTRFRGDTTTSDHEHDEHAEASDGDESSRKLAVGAPIHKTMALATLPRVLGMLVAALLVSTASEASASDCLNMDKLPSVALGSSGAYALQSRVERGGSLLCLKATFMGTTSWLGVGIARSNLMVSTIGGPANVLVFDAAKMTANTYVVNGKGVAKVNMQSDQSSYTVIDMTSRDSLTSVTVSRAMSVNESHVYDVAIAVDAPTNVIWAYGAKWPGKHVDK
ncbi:hypothetical protein DYB34_008854, partial [Aphanomyces astaci]